MESLSNHNGQRLRDTILNWFSTNDYALQHSDQLSRRAQGTGQWFLDHPVYQQWRNGGKATLLGLGIPGSGKSMMAAMVIEQLRQNCIGDDKTVVIYYYCNFQRQDDQQINKILATLIRQLLRGLSRVPESVRNLYETHHGQDATPSTEQLREVLMSLTQEYNQVYIVVDALDECLDTTNTRTSLLDSLFEAQQWPKTSVGLLATSRSVPEVEARFQTALRVEIRAHEEDIHQYLSQHINELKVDPQKELELAGVKMPVREAILARITHLADGMLAQPSHEQV